ESQKGERGYCFRLRGFFRGALKPLDYSYQVRYRLRVHLLHSPAAMNLHGIFRSSQLTGNLFIEHARNDHGDHLLLARSQGVEALLEVRYFFLLFVSSAISLQCDANSIQQILVAVRFGEEFNCTGLHSTNTHGNIAVTGDKDYRDTNVSRCKLALKIESTKSPKSDVQHKASGGIWRFSLHEGFSRAKALKLQTHAAEEKLERRTY